MSSPPLPVALSLSRKRTHSQEDDLGSPVDAKKIRISPATSTSSKQDKRRRRKKKKATPVVDDKLNRDSSKHGGAKLLSLFAQDIPDDHTNDPEEPIASSSHYTVQLPSPKRYASPTHSLSPAPSSSSSSQGTEKETAEMGRTVQLGVAATTLFPTEEEQIATLKEQLSSQKELLEKQSNLVLLFQQSLMCQVCIDLMYKPFVLSPCGHLVCYSCLVNWFKSPAPGSNEHQNPIFKRKTCPHCRAVVRDRPMEVYSVKEMVTAMEKSGLAVNIPPRVDEPTTGAPRDPWEGIFRKHPARRQPGQYLPFNELPPGIEFLHANGDLELDDDDYDDDDNDDDGDIGIYDDGDTGIYDEEDSVYRCTDCLHELWDGICSQCGRVYQALRQPVDDQSDGNIDDITLARFAAGGVPPNAPDFALIDHALHLGMMLGGHFATSDDDLEEPVIEEAEDDELGLGYESSFIDDDEGGPEVIDLAGSEDENDVMENNSSSQRTPRRSLRAPRVTRRTVVVSSDGEDREVVLTSVRAPRAIRSPVSSTTSRNSDQIRWDSEDDAEEESVNRFASPVVDEEDEDDGSISRTPINLAHFMEDPEGFDDNEIASDDF